MLLESSILLALAASAHGHVVGWAVGMYCKGGSNTTEDDQNTSTAVNPLYQLPQEQWWFQADRGCDKAPPKAGEILSLPAGGAVTLELAHNRGQTSLSFGGQYSSEWPDGSTHPENWMGPGNPPGCIEDDGAMHVQNQSMAAGTALAISYESDITQVTLENLVVFSVLEHTPWKRLASYSVPKALPNCPPGGCHCAWLWIPNGCGTPNMYMAGYKCQVTGATSTVPLAVPANAPVYCGDDSSKCVKGPKQMMAWNQLTGNNVSPPNFISPAYGTIMGYSIGAQNDIFASTPPASSVATSSSSSTTIPVVVPPSSTSTTTTTPIVVAPTSTPPASSVATSSSSSTVPVVVPPSSTSTTTTTPIVVAPSSSSSTTTVSKAPGASSSSVSVSTVTITQPAVTITRPAVTVTKVARFCTA